MPEPDRSAYDGYISRYRDSGQARILGVSGRELLGDPRVQVLRARDVLVEAVPALGAVPPPAFADGERIGPLPLQLSVVPGALSVLA